MLLTAYLVGYSCSYWCDREASPKLGHAHTLFVVFVASVFYSYLYVSLLNFSNNEILREKTR